MQLALALLLLLLLLLLRLCLVRCICCQLCPTAVSPVSQSDHLPCCLLCC
jgi:hypothetical protein